MRLFTQFYFGLTGFAAPVPEVMGRLRELLEVGLPSSPRSDDQGAALFGLGALGIRQAQAIVVMIDHGIADQAMTLARSLYETMVTQRNIRVEARLATEFTDYQACVNRRVKDSLEREPEAAEYLQAIPPHVLERVDQEWEQYKFDYPGKAPTRGKYNPPPSWSQQDLMTRAAQAEMQLQAHYQWLCGFTHTSAQAIRELFVERAGQFHLEPSQRSDFLPFFTLFCLASILDLTFEAFGLRDARVDDAVSWLDPLTSR